MDIKKNRENKIKGDLRYVVALRNGRAGEPIVVREWNSRDEFSRLEKILLTKGFSDMPLEFFKEFIDEMALHIDSPPQGLPCPEETKSGYLAMIFLIIDMRHSQRDSDDDDNYSFFESCIH